MSKPLVSVICLCYNHQDYVEETLASVWQQEYEHIEVFIVDDGSTDNSVQLIENYLATHPCPYPCKTLFLKKNMGNCAAFNQAWRMAKGKYVIDLATDDIMLPKRVSMQIAYFEKLPKDYGVVFTESQYIDGSGNTLAYHFTQKYRHIRPVPSGEIYQHVVSRYFISSPTMMYKNEVLHHLNGYDEDLAYEDFDFWVRSSRNYKYAYLDECTTLVRKLDSSMSRQLYKVNDRQLYSTYLVCQKAYNLNKTVEEKKALLKRIHYELKQAIFSNNYLEARLFLNLLKTVNGKRIVYKIIDFIMLLKPNFWFLRKIYFKINSDA